ncbi:MAG: type II toxin-antitoxin system VapC family toxin [Terriglobales bacterium]
MVDASFVVAASLSREGLQRLQGREAVAPPLLWSEALSALHELRWREAVPPHLAESARLALEAAPLAVRAPARLRQEAWAIASRLGWAKTYDAEYVALARLSGCPLLTLDARLGRAVARLVELLDPKAL